MGVQSDVQHLHEKQDDKLPHYIKPEDDIPTIKIDPTHAISPFLLLNLDDFKIVPIVLLESCSFIKDKGIIQNLNTGLDTPGLFRIAPAKTALLEARRRYNMGVRCDFVALGGIHIACGILKLWYVIYPFYIRFRELPEPVVTAQHYPILESLVGNI
jgi:hypothetical protein